MAALLLEVCIRTMGVDPIPEDINM